MPYADKIKDLEYHRQYNKMYDLTTTLKHCIYCNQNYQRKNYATHLKTNKHIENEAKNKVPETKIIEPIITELINEPTKYKRCECCFIKILKINVSRHEKSQSHKNNIIKKIDEVYMTDFNKWNSTIKCMHYNINNNSYSTLYPELPFWKAKLKVIKEWNIRKKYYNLK